MNKVIKEAKSKQVEAESNVAFLSIENQELKREVHLSKFEVRYLTK